MKNKHLIFSIIAMIISLAAGSLTALGQNGSARLVKAGAASSKKTKASKSSARKNNRREDRDEDEEKDQPRTVRMAANASREPEGPISMTASAFGRTSPIRDLPQVRYGTKPVKGEVRIEDNENNELILERTVPGAGDFAKGGFEDLLAVSSRKSAFAPQTMPGPTLTFNGMLSNNVLTTFGTTSMPPDTTGDVGPNHYVQATNIGLFQVFDKSGTALTAMARISTLFSGLPSNNKCRKFDNGDPVVNYDPLADRWLISQFAVADDGGDSSSPYYQCVAVSQTGDPTGAWYAYAFRAPNTNFPDYPHWGVWTDGYYLAVHEFNDAGTAYMAGGFFAFNRDKMLVGDPTANYIYFSRAASGGHLPVDIDGFMPPPPGTPEMFFEYDANEFGGSSTDALLGYDFVPDFATPANSTLTPKPALPVAAFDPTAPASRNVIEQPSPATSSQYVDAISDRLLFRIAYRNLGTTVAPVNSYVMNWTVNVSGLAGTTAATHQAGIRWEELRRDAGGSLSIFDQGTHAPDPASGTGRNRWMGSIAQDNNGNIALGFSRSGSGAADFPDLVWAGRTGGQTPAGVLNEGETTMFASTGVQQTTNGRWGDYSTMTVDPTDDCTFWYTSIYRDSAFNGTGSNNPFKWSTRIGTFKFPSCTAQPKGTMAVNVTSCATGLPINGARVVATAGNFSYLTNVAGLASIIAAPGSYTVSASKNGLTAASTGASVVDGSTTPVSVCLGGSLVNSTTAAVTSESCAVNSFADPGELMTVDLGLQDAAGANTSNLTATLLTTGGVVAASGPQNYGALTSGGAAVTRPFSFTVDPSIKLGSNVTLTLALSDGGNSLGNVTYTLPTSTTPAATQNFDFSGALAIPDNNVAGANATFSVSGVTGTIQDLNVSFLGTVSSATNPSTTVGLDHPSLGNLVVHLTSPAGTSVTLMNRTDSTTGTNGGCTSNNIYQMTLDDSAATQVDSGCPGSASTSGPMTGSFKPVNALSLFNGENPNGTWTMNVVDLASTNTGTLRAARLAITPFGASCATSKIWTGAVSTDWNDPANWSPNGVPTASDSVVIPATGVTSEPSIVNPDVTVANLTVVSPRVLTVTAGRTLNVSGTTLINGTLTVIGSASFASAPSLASSTVIYNGAAAQNVAAFPYNNLVIDNPAGATLTAGTTVGGTLTLTNGTLDTGGNTLTVATCSPSAVTGGSASSYVKGSLARCVNGAGSYAFPVGTNGGYAPVSLANVVGTGNFNVSAVDGTLAGTAGNASLLRYWGLTPDAGVTQADVTLNYLDTDVPLTANENVFKFIRRSGGMDFDYAPTSFDTMTNSFTLNGVSSFSQWTLGRLAPTAAGVSVSGRVLTSGGRALANAVVVLQAPDGTSRSVRTNSFGYYRFDDVASGENYVISASAKGQRFTPRVVTVADNLTDVDLTAN
ncbi:MAG: carboxypeptidase regulatory-like domain-containing protein [Acidobacteria bacterium]|nr:carboxypeptidase regulatory-like domain-containing protein [Acidobacteriota bacterium]